MDPRLYPVKEDNNSDKGVNSTLALPPVLSQMRRETTISNSQMMMAQSAEKMESAEEARMEKYSGLPLKEI
jgi:hypothetical protein